MIVEDVWAKLYASNYRRKRWTQRSAVLFAMTYWDDLTIKHGGAARLVLWAYLRNERLKRSR